MKSKSFAVIGCCLLFLSVLSSAANVSAQRVNNTADDVIPEIMFTKVAKKKAAVLAERAEQLF